MAKAKLGKRASVIDYATFDNYELIAYMPKDCDWELYDALSAGARTQYNAVECTGEKSAGERLKRMVAIGIVSFKGKMPKYYGQAERYRGLDRDGFVAAYLKLARDCEERKMQKRRYGEIESAEENSEPIRCEPLWGSE